MKPPKIKDSTNFPSSFVYLVYCNKPPEILYAAFREKAKAVRYAIFLIRWRQSRAKKLNQPFGYYHFRPYISKVDTIDHALKTKNVDSLWFGTDIFSVCLSFPEEKKTNYGEDGCRIRVVRMVLQ